MRIIFWSVVAVVMVVGTDRLSAQTQVFKASKILADLETAKPRPTDQARTVRMLESPGKVVQVARRVAGTAQPAIIHGKFTEVHYIIDGRATLVIDGTLVGSKGPSPSGDASGTGIEGGQKHAVGKGDIILIPPGAPHQYTEIDGSLTYFENRFDTSALPPVK